MVRSWKLTLVLAMFLLAEAAHAESWAERMWRQVNKKVSAELVDAKLSEACDLLTSLTGLTIILAPEVRQKDPVLTLRVKDMDAGTALKWFTQLTETYADVVDQAIYITDKPSAKVVEEEKQQLQEIGAKHGVVVEVPPGGMPLTKQDIVKAALQIMEKEQVKVQDFPAPEVGLGMGETGAGPALDKR
ncbi:MAG: hypothetical protein NTW87_23685 [Planctomycetota bacterium]|nr:hypothetical protein [Planctomycetota bacterium]